MPPRRRSARRPAARPARRRRTGLMRRSFSRRLPRRAAIFASTTDNQLKAIDFSWNKLTQPESPFLQIPSTTDDNDGALCVNTIANGTGFYQRIGRKVTLRSIRIFAQLQGRVESVLSDNASNPNALTVRLVVIFDRQPGTELPKFHDIFRAYTNAGVSGSQSYAAPLDMTKTGRFRVLRDKTYDLQPTIRNVINLSDQVYQTVQVDEYIKLPNIETVYQASSDPPVLGDISSGAVYIYMRSSLDSIDGDWRKNRGFASLENGNIRVRYTDRGF